MSIFRTRRVYSCNCGRPVFFRNSFCLGCQIPLGYQPALGSIVPVEPSGDGYTWRVKGQEQPYLRCRNLESPSACNWLADADEAKNPAGLCLACRLNRTIPNLDVDAHKEGWRKIEIAKRQLISSLLAAGLPVVSKDQDPVAGLAFDFLSDDGGEVLTGHKDGIVTLNIAEADDGTREALREQLAEPYRTVLGHLRHEIGHYYWDRLIRGSQWLGGFRDVFGDDRTDYKEALETHYRQGPPVDWRQRFVSAYASSHPWEDWAETWAHYLHIGDTLNTAANFGLQIDSVEMTIGNFENSDLTSPDEAFLDSMNSWIRLTAALNELSRSMGIQDFYPFVLSKNSVQKLHFVHRVITNVQDFGPRQST